jgi:hypothetical protein
MRIVILAFIIRVIFYMTLCVIYPTENISTRAGDPEEYYYMATHHLDVMQERAQRFHYQYWYQRTPLYTLFLYLLTPQIAVFIQMLIGSIGVYLMYLMNKKAGYIWMFYEIPYSIIFLKECLMYALIITIIYKFKGNKGKV